MEYELSWGGSEVEDLYLRTWGPASLDGLVGYMNEGLGDSRWHEQMRVLIDHRAVDWSVLGTDDLRKRADFILSQRDRLGGARVAVVVASSAAFGVVRMMQGFGDDYGNDQLMAVRVFYSVDDARDWLREPSSTPPR